MTTVSAFRGYWPTRTHANQSRMTQPQFGLAETFDAASIMLEYIQSIECFYKVDRGFKVPARGIALSQIGKRDILLTLLRYFPEEARQKRGNWLNPSNKVVVRYSPSLPRLEQGLCTATAEIRFKTPENAAAFCRVMNNRCKRASLLAQLQQMKWDSEFA